MKTIFLFLVCFLYSSTTALARTEAEYVVDLDTYAIHYQKNANTIIYPASLTKLMTVYLVLEKVQQGTLNLNSYVKVSRYAAGQAPSKINLIPGSQITVHDALLATIIKSANDASVVLAEAHSGTEKEFVKAMNRKAKELGMTKTHFSNSNGLFNKNQVSTAKDMAILAQNIMKKHESYFSMFSKTSFSYNGNLIKSHNRVLLNNQGLVDGLKTGYIRQSGFNIVTTARSPQTGKRFIIVVIGKENAAIRDKRVQKLLNDYATMKITPKIRAAHGK